MFVNLIDGEGIIHSKRNSKWKDLKELLPEGKYGHCRKDGVQGSLCSIIVNEHGQLRREYYYPIDMEGSTGGQTQYLLSPWIIVRKWTD